MSANKPKALVLCGQGLTGAHEMMMAMEMVGFDVDLVHVDDLDRHDLDSDKLSSIYSSLCIPSGQSFGGHLGTGRVLALYLSQKLKWDLQLFASRGGVVLGVSEGFETLIKMNLFGKEISVAWNGSHKFKDTWTRIEPSSQKCIWTKGLGAIDLPLRYPASKIVVSVSRQKEVWSKLERQGMLCLKFDKDKQLEESIYAGICDQTGRILGMFPRPECFVRFTSMPEWTLTPARAGSPGQGLMLFENAFHEVSRSI